MDNRVWFAGAKHLFRCTLANISGDDLHAGRNIHSATRIQADHLVTGVVVPPDQTQLTLPPDVLQSLEAGRSYFWRVRALAIDGSVLAESPSRELRVPPSWRGNQNSGP